MIYHEDGEEATFTLPSRAARRYSLEFPGQVEPADMRQNSDLEEDGDISTVTADNVTDFAAAWARKELVTNTVDQMTVLMQGVADIRGAQAILTTFTTAGGWQALQRHIRGAVDIDVAEWRLATTHDTRSGSAGIAARDNFWAVVATISAEDKIKLLQYWCSKLPPAGGVRALGRGSTYPITLIVKDMDGYLPRAATCFHQMVIPAIADMAKMEEVVANAVAHYSDFGLT